MLFDWRGVVETMEEIKKIYVSDPVKRYIVDLVNRTRQNVNYAAESLAAIQ